MIRRTLLSLFAVGLFALVGCSRSGTAPAASPGELKTMSVEQVATRLAAHDGKTFVYDNNPKDRYALGHVPGAKWVESGDVTAAILPPDKGATLIFYCASEL